MRRRTCETNKFSALFESQWHKIVENKIYILNLTLNITKPLMFVIGIKVMFYICLDLLIDHLKNNLFNLSERYPRTHYVHVIPLIYEYWEI